MKKYFIKETNDVVEIGDYIKTIVETTCEGKTTRECEYSYLDEDLLKDLIKKGFVIEKEVKEEKKITIQKVTHIGPDDDRSFNRTFYQFIDFLNS